MDRFYFKTTRFVFWLGWQDSNLRMTESKSVALTTLATSHRKGVKKNRFLQIGSSSMGRVIGLEPTTPGTTIRCSSQLSYTRHIVARLKRLELLTHCLEGSCSIQLSYRRLFGRGAVERVMGIEPTQSAWKADVLPLNYTRVCQQGDGGGGLPSKSALL